MSVTSDAEMVAGIALPIPRIVELTKHKNHQTKIKLFLKTRRKHPLGVLLGTVCSRSHYIYLS